MTAAVPLSLRVGTGGAADPPRMKPLLERFPGERGCNPIGFNEHGHDSAITFSRHPGAGRDPCFRKHLSLIAFRDRVPSDSSTPAALWVPACPTDLGPWAEGPRDGVICSEEAMKANWITASKAGTHAYPVLVPRRDGPRLFAGEVFNMTCPLQPSCFVLVPHRRCRPAVHETAARTLSRRKPGPIGPPTERWKGGPRLSAGASHLSYPAPEPSCFVLAKRSNPVLPLGPHVP
jgi:hypothetical protein